MSDSRLIVALDVSTLADVQRLVRELGDSIDFYKVGMQLFYGQGPEVLQELRSHNKQIFFDLKLHDIPNTVAKATAELTGLGAEMLTVHAIGGKAMMQASVEAAADQAAKLGVPCPKIVAVTVLTSMNDSEWQKLHYESPIADQVLRLAELAREAGVDGVVASPQEAAKIREICGPEFIIVTPGIRPAGSATQDQSRIATPAQALKLGASYLVVGRPITQADNCQQAALNILAEMGN